MDRIPRIRKRTTASLACTLAAAGAVLLSFPVPSRATEKNESSIRLRYVPIETSHQYSITVETSHPVELVVTRSAAYDQEVAHAASARLIEVFLGNGSELLKSRRHYASVIGRGEAILPAHAVIRVIDELGNEAGRMEMTPSVPVNPLTEFFAGIVFVPAGAEHRPDQSPQ